jgi:hypothetical protein
MVSGNRMKKEMLIALNLATVSNPPEILPDKFLLNRT